MITQVGRLALDTTRPWQAEYIARGLAAKSAVFCKRWTVWRWPSLPSIRGNTDILALDRRNGFIIVEIKSGLAYFRSDSKWPDYLAYCDRFYFAVAADFLLSKLLPKAGIILARPGANDDDIDILRSINFISLTHAARAGIERQLLSQSIFV